MYDVIANELERLAPLREVGRPEWADVLTRSRERGARRFAPVVAIAAIAIAVPTVALSSDVRGLLGLGHPAPVLASAEPLVSGFVGNGFYAHLWQSPSTTGGTCLFSTFDHTATVSRPPRDWRGGGSCGAKRTTTVSPVDASHPLAVSFSIQRRLGVAPRKWIPPVVAGSVYPGLHATRIAVVWRGGSHGLTLRNGWFVGGSRGFFIPPLRKFPFVVVAYDNAGQEVARKKLDSPSLLMLSHGWKEFARKYHAWKAHRQRK
jgi:hypothetical protein